MNRIPLIVLFMVLSLAIPFKKGYGQADLENMSLEQVINRSVENNLTLKSAVLDEKFSKEQTREVRATGLPQINASGSFQDYLKIPTSLLPAEIVGGEAGTFVPVQFGTKYNVTAGVEATQLLFSQSYLVGLKAAKSAQELALLNTRKAKEDLVHDVSLTYYNAQISQKQLEILQANLEKLIKQIEISDLQYQNGIIKKLDLDRLKVSRTNLETDIENLQTAHQQQLNLVKFFMGVPLSQHISLDSTVDESAGSLLSINKDVNIYQNRTDFQLLNKQKELYNLELKNTQAGYFPNLSAFARFNTQAMRQEFNFFDGGKPWFETGIIGLQLNVPLFDGLAKRSKAQQSRIKLLQTENSAQLLKQSIELDITNANAKLINSRKALAAQKENRQLAEEVYTQTQLQYKEGLASMTDLLNAETSMREAQNNYIRALVETMIARLELKKVDGSLLQYVQNQE